MKQVLNGQRRADQLGGVPVESDELAEPDRAARTRHVVHLGATDEIAQRLLHGACGLVPAAAGGGRRHDPKLLIADRAFGGCTRCAFPGAVTTIATVARTATRAGR